MNKFDTKKYKINIDTRILELLGPNLYTNIHYILAELIANSYDAGAKNVYIIQKEDSIIVEDDGIGMSYGDGIKKYLNVAKETRVTDEDSYILVDKKRRRKMGRKGIGKLAALSVSKNVFIMTKHCGEKSGFILSRKIGPNGELKALEDDEIQFEKIQERDSGTSVVMTNPEYGFDVPANVLKRHLVKIFPLVSKDFKIHIMTEDETIIVKDFNIEIIGSMGGLITFGKEFKYLTRYFRSGLKNRKEREGSLISKRDVISEKIKLKNKYGKSKEYILEIRGWLGIYRSTSGRKIDSSDFPDNFISLLSNGKLGEYNILPFVGRNSLLEAFVVGQLHIDLFEETELTDMSLSNRQGYRSDDERYIKTISKVREILPELIKIRTLYASYNKADKEKEKFRQMEKEEEKLRKSVDNYKKTASTNVSKRILQKFGVKKDNELKEIVEEEINSVMPLMGLKSKVDSQKKRILISHSGIDKDLADVVYKMLSFNNVPDKDILYTNCEKSGCWIPPGSLGDPQGLYKYLRSFFVDSYSNKKLFVIYITSEAMSKSWNAVSEVGAGWITQSSNKIFNIEGWEPQQPLNLEPEYQICSKDENGIILKGINFNKFIVSIIRICGELGYTTKTLSENIKELGRYVVKKR